MIVLKFHSKNTRSNRILCSLFMMVALWATIVGSPCHAFSSFPSQCLTPDKSKLTTQLSSVGNWISGVTNTPPSSLLSSSPKLITSLTESTSLQDKELACIYKGSKDGWSAVNFHRCVDEKGSCLVVVLTRAGVLMGGFNPVGWRSTDDYYNSNAAFLWYTTGSGGEKAVKCPVLAGGEYPLPIHTRDPTPDDSLIFRI